MSNTRMDGMHTSIEDEIEHLIVTRAEGSLEGTANNELSTGINALCVAESD